MKKLVSAAVTAAALMVAGNASALTISFSDTLGPQPTELVDETLTLALFDDMGGTRTLNSVSISVAGDLGTSGTVTNNGVNPQDFTVFEFANQFDGTPTGPASLQQLFVFPTANPPFSFGSVVAQQTYNQLAGGATATFGPGSISGADSFVISAPADLADFIGPGSFSYDFNTEISILVNGGGGNISTAIGTDAAATLTVVYDFDEVLVAVPAPAGIALFALGLLGMRRLRK